MNWDALGALGEILGSLAVLGTLIYLAIQVKDARKAFYLQTSQSLNDQFNASLSLIASSPTIAQIARKAEAGEPLSEDEYIQYRAMLQTVWNAWENGYMHSKVRVGFTTTDLKNGIIAFLATPGARDCWEFQKAFVSGEFREYISELIDELPRS